MSHSTGDDVVERKAERLCDQLRGDPDTWRSAATEVSVVVVGGGVAGLSAVQTLLKSSITDIILLEAQAYLGGRIKTYRQGDILVEDGAEWIHGDARNPVHRLAASLHQLDHITPHHLWDYRVVTESGEMSSEDEIDLVEGLVEDADDNGVLEPYYNTSYGQYYEDRLEEAGVVGGNYTGLRHYLQQRVSYEEGTGMWDEISARDADQYVNYGDNYHWRHGYDTLITHLKSGLPDGLVRLSSPVCRVYWDRPHDHRALVVTSQGMSYLASYVIYTASVAHMQENHHHTFHPPLPRTLATALDGILLGVANKIHIGWTEPWWGDKPLDIVIIWNNWDLPDYMRWIRGIVRVFSVHNQRAVLQMFVTGNSSTYMESLPEKQVQQHVMLLLSRVTKENIPQPAFFRRSAWGSNPWTRGSYSSFITVDGDKKGLHSRTQLATPLRNSHGHTVLVWAGEHTHNTRYSTVDGALETGRREGERIAAALRKTPLPPA